MILFRLFTSLLLLWGFSMLAPNSCYAQKTKIPPKKNTKKVVATKPTAKPQAVVSQADTLKKDAKPASQTDKFLTTTEVPTIELNTKKVLAEKEKQLKKELGALFTKKSAKTKVKKEPKNTYRGIKGKKSFTRSESQYSNRVSIEKFYFVKEQKTPPNYVAEIYYFDPTKRKIVKTTKYNPEKGFLMHGLYTKKTNGLLAEEGYFYLGAKDGRWERYSKDTLLTDKRYFDTGFLQESEVVYFDKNKKVLRQLVSIHNGYKEGEYLLYFPSGRMATKGQYAEDIKIGVWYEYYDQVKFARKAEIKYRDSPYEEADSVILRQWDEKGKLLFDNTRKK
jgi:antitoxin component YwqK of YwqJK toxin-antitoxin module